MAKTVRDRLEEMASGFTQARILISAVELDLFNHLGTENKTAEQVARQGGYAEEPTRRLLNALVGLKLLSKKNNKFKNSQGALLHLTDQGKEPLESIMLHRASMWRAWSALTQIVRTGKIPPKESSHETEKHFIKGMANVSAISAPQTADAIRGYLKKASRLMDLGGGPGVYGCEFAKKNPRLKVVVKDLPSPLLIAKETIRSTGLSKQVKTQACDVLKNKSYGRGYDIVFLSNFIHCFKRPEAKTILSKAANALKKGGHLIIKDFNIREDGAAPPFSTLFSINMLVMDAGDLYSREEMEHWFNENSVKLERRIPVAVNSEILIGKKGH